MHSSARNSTRGLVAAGVAAVAAAGLSGCTWFGATMASKGTPPSAAATSKPGVPSEPTFYDRPEPTAVATDPRPASTPKATPDASVPVLITFSGWDADAKAVQVGGNVTGVIESDGTCTVTLTKSGRTLTASAPGQPDATTTDCTGLTVPGATAGVWQAVLTYRSAAHTGTSAPAEVDVP